MTGLRATTSTVAAHPWQFHAHPEVWLLVGSLIALYVYAVHHIGPKVVKPGEPIVTRAQKRWFGIAMAMMWIASDWPMHDIGERYLYSVHMLQHMILGYVMPGILLLGIPTWLARLVIGPAGSRSYQLAKRFTRPVVAGVIFNAFVALSHIPAVVNYAVNPGNFNGVVHFTMHLFLVASAVMLWMCVCGPIPEFRISLPSQMAYLFLNSVLPTVPAGWLTFAEGAVYKAYNHDPRLWTISVTSDQQFAGFIMKIIGSTYLWAIIIALFSRWMAGHTANLDHSYRRTPGSRIPPREIVGHDEVPLTYDEVTQAFDRAEAPVEPTKSP